VKSDNDALLILKGPLCSDVPKTIAPYIDTIKTQLQWEQLGFNVKHDQFGNYNSIVKNGLHFRFRKASKVDELVLLSVQSGKVYETYPNNFYCHIIFLGRTFEDFAYISDDAKAYCNARLFLKDNELQQAFDFIQEAIKLNSSQHDYYTLRFDICFALQDLSSVDKELDWYIDDIDCMAHSGNIERWLKLLIKKRGSSHKAVQSSWHG